MSQLIDTHIHIYSRPDIGRFLKEEYEILDYGARETPVTLSGYDGDTDSAVEAIDRAELDFAVVLNIFEVTGWPGPAEGVYWPTDEAPLGKYADDFVQSNYFTTDLRNRSEKLIPFVSAHPGVLQQNELRTHLVDCFDSRDAAGVKLHPNSQRIHPADPSYRLVYQELVERDLPLVAHSGEDKKEQGLADLDSFSAVAEDFPRLKLILAHLGGNGWKYTAEFANTYPAVFFDLCEIIEWTNSERGPTRVQLARLIQQIGVSRVLMGSDFPWYDMDRTIELVHDLPLLGQEEKDLLCGGNAARLLKL